MGITANFNTADIQKRFDAFLVEIEKAQIKRLQKLGEMCVTHARNIAPKSKGGDGFDDITGNLRSSIGYMVFVDGTAVHTGYEQVKGGSEGIQKGQALAKKVGEASNGICLVVTAGMNYALYVESKGRDVIASAEHLAQRELPRMLENLIANIKKT